MMKKLIVLCFGFLFLLTGCGGRTTYDEVSYEKLNNMLDSKQSFILMIGRETCSACSSYKLTLNRVISDYNVDVKYIDLDKLSDSDESELIAEFPLTGTPQTIFIKNGVEEDTHNRIDGNLKYSKVVEKFKENGYIKG